MEESDLVVMRQMIGKAVEECVDMETLDLVYKILIADDIR